MRLREARILPDGASVNEHLPVLVDHAPYMEIQLISREGLPPVISRLRCFAVSVCLMPNLGWTQERSNTAPTPAMTGPWETMGTVNGRPGQLGIHIQFRRNLLESAASLHLTVWAYEAEGDFIAGVYCEPKLEDNRLVFQTDGGKRKWDLSFDTESRTWSGSLSENGIIRNVKLERPKARDSLSNPLAGDWASQEDERRFRLPSLPGCLHGVIRPNGQLVLWLDRELTWQKSYGDQLGNANIKGNQVNFMLAGMAAYSFTGVLSGNDDEITGDWSPGLQAPSVFVKADNGPCAR